MHPHVAKITEGLRRCDTAGGSVFKLSCRFFRDDKKKTELRVSCCQSVPQPTTEQRRPGTSQYLSCNASLFKILTHIKENLGWQDVIRITCDDATSTRGSRGIRRLQGRYKMPPFLDSETVVSNLENAPQEQPRPAHIASRSTKWQPPVLAP